MDPGKLTRSLLVGSSTLLAIVVLFWMQSKYDGADRKAALGVVSQYRSPGGWTIPEVLDTRHPGHPAVWAVQNESSCLHHYEKVSADVDGIRYQFMVDIDGPSIHPGNRESEAVLKQLGEPRPSAPPPAASGARVDGSGSAASGAPVSGSAASGARVDGSGSAQKPASPPAPGAP